MPRQLQAVKSILLLCIIAYKLISHRFSISFYSKCKYFNRFLAFSLASSLVGIIGGLLNGNPGIIDAFRLGIVYVLLLSFLFLTVDSSEEANWINEVIIFWGTLVALYTILHFLVNIGIWPRSLFYEFDYTTRLGFHAGYVHMTNTNASMLLPILPLTVVSYLTTREEFKTSYLRFIEMGLIVLAAVLTGRRAVWLTIPFVIGFAFFLQLFGKGVYQKWKKKQRSKNIKRFLIIIVAIFAVAYILISRGYLDLTSIALRYQAVMSGGEEYSVRSDQARALIDGFMEQPIFGHGSGASAAVVRSADFGWAYELSYHALLFHTGIVGFSLYMYALVMIVTGLYSGAKKKDDNFSWYVSLLAAVLMGIIANSTNPYFSSSFDFFWWILWPLSYVYVLEKSKVKVDKGV